MLSSFVGGRLYGSAYGNAPARVVALHGWARTHADFARVLGPYDAIALDLPGFGATPAPPEPWGSAEYAGLVADVLRELTSPPVVVGHSLGGRVGIHLAATYPDLIGGLVLTGAPLIRTAAAGKPKTGYRLARWMNKRGVLSDARMEAARKKYGSSDYANASPTMRAVHVKLVNENYDAQIAAARGPIELVWGDDDTAAPIAGAQQLAARLGDRATLTVIEGAGHLTPMSAANELRSAIDRLLA
ncbi:MAG: alpha/beta hydrolase [Actinobacteria bacterium]|nr:alpha/beta hydrolase [Actinomycetota bacterium]